MKIAKQDIQIGMQFALTENSINVFNYDPSGYYSMDNAVEIFSSVGNISITSLVYRNKGNGDMIRFNISNSPKEFTTWWAAFKRSTKYVPTDSIILNPVTKIPKLKKTKWSEMQAARLGAPGYYIEYYGKPNEYPSEYSVIYIGVGKCRYIHYNSPPNRQDWASLLWSCAPTKRKINTSITDIENVIYRYHFFETHEDLIKYKGIYHKPGAMIPVVE